MPKTNKYCFVAFSESFDLGEVLGWLTHQHFQALISPEHSKDIWNPYDVFHYIETQQQRYKVKIDETMDTWRRPTGRLVGRAIETEEVPLPKVGQPKKSHRHFVIKLDYSCPLQTMFTLFEDSPLKLSYFEPVRSERGIIRYLCHLDNPEKAPYPKCDVISLGGYDTAPLYDATRNDVAAICSEVMEQLVAYPEISLQTLSKKFYAEGNFDCFNEIRNHAYFWRGVTFHNDKKDGSVKVA